MGCELTYEQLSQLAAGDLDPSRAQELERHVSQCNACQARLQALGEVDGVLRRLPRREPSARTVLAVRDRLLEEARGDQEPEIMTLDEVASFLRIPLADLEELVADLPVFEVAGHVRVRRSRLLEWIAGQERRTMQSHIASEVSGILSGGLEKGVA